MKIAPCSLALAGLMAAASAQSEIVGVDVRNNESFTSSTVNFVNNYTVLAPESRNIYGLDFDAAGNTLYGVDDATLEVLTIDPVTGISTALGPFITGPGLTGLTGLTAAADGVTWYLSDYDGVDSNLFRGDITTGVFSFVGVIAPGGIMIDIAIDANDNLYGLRLSDDTLYSLDTATGAPTAIGPIGLNANFAQGMDFDPATGELYAAIYTGTGTGKFCTLDLTTGLANQLEDTFVLNAEMEMAIRAVPDTGIGTPYCTANPNSTGVAGSISAAGSDAVIDNDLTLTAEQLPNNSFGFFIVSPLQGFAANPGGSSGNLCLAGSIGRYVGPGQIKNSGAAGAFSLMINLTAIPTPTGPVAATAGSVFNFQSWYRDSSGGVPTSNFTNGLEVTFQ
ncbi:hypothetical protein Poly30_29380 [Planctomycetes bacterium Poly30]|uniref:DUF4394 domain-containing protein n=1 Tax=Saltatorellus ferox TaxID=2528018 RepID=A0A518ETJ1_9BACT|nr:hypothetical protein Poly30_29380 [Planctomycetes bacterium Poly30]